MRGITVLIIVLAVVCVSGIGGKMWDNVKQKESSCYSALYRLGSLSSPICDAVARGVGAIDNSLSGISEKFRTWKLSTFGDLSDLDGMTSSIGDRLTRFASSNETLTKMMQAGPGSFGSSARQSVQQAIDSFTIGQGYMKQGGTSSNMQAIEWFQRGAQQPQGYGVMSQLALGNIYANGQGVPQNSQAAKLYLEQANRSITTLMGNGSPQSQQLLESLPGPPAQVKAQLDAAIRQLSARN